ncbi:hypothetical protein GIB67_029804 [Kingdonia uniflora]|uniref:Gamma-secretase subunit PEN-2 n=1 Tax=Kingdonia uniflora TaxID=39325 RepID=A0A7J7NJ27_9MAGN|nr:hypothetical protein GIB67_029804 [Kingdonia uniflora]
MERVEITSGTLEGEIRAMGIGGNGESVGLINSSNNREPLWPTVDGSLGLSEEESLHYARRFFNFGFCLLPWLWAVNCYYFWPVLHQSPSSFPRLRRFSSEASLCPPPLSLEIFLPLVPFDLGCPETISYMISYKLAPRSSHSSYKSLGQ